MTLTRKTPLRAKPRSKGARGERAVIDLLKAQGWTGAYRNAGSGAFGGGDIIGGPADVNLEVKHHETAKIWEWLRQSEADARPTEIPTVICRCNGMPWFAVLPRHEWDALRLLDLKPVGTVLVEPGRRLSLWKHIGAAIDVAGKSLVPQLVFSRAGSEVYVAVPAEELLRLLWMRERGT